MSRVLAIESGRMQGLTKHERLCLCYNQILVETVILYQYVLYISILEQTVDIAPHLTLTNI